MAKASFKLPDGTLVVIEGSPEEVNKLIQLYATQSSDQEDRRVEKKDGKKKAQATVRAKRKETGAFDITDIVNLVKTCDEADSIEIQILDRTSQVHRTLLPLYIIYQYLDNAHDLTSGEISKINTDLGIPISQANTSKALSTTAARYVVGDKVKKKGRPVRYKLSRRGHQYIKTVLKGTNNG